MAKISKSVGEKGKNLPADVKTIQGLLNDHAKAVGYKSVKVTGQVDKDTTRAIRAFQEKVVKIKPDGRVDPNKRTIAALSQKAAALAKTLKAADQEEKSKKAAEPKGKQYVVKWKGTD